MADSFNDADYLHFWNQLASFGSLYQINTGTLTANQLRNIENELRSFENDVHVLNRVYSDYMSRQATLLKMLGGEASAEELQQFVPLVNSITEKTVELEVLIQDFSKNIFDIARLLRSVESGGHF